MYQMNDKKAAVREIQTYLYWLAVSGEYPIPQVIPNGEYGPQTAEGVLVFQKRCGIEETGAVDRATFDALYREYRRVRAQIAAKERGNFPDESEFPIGIGRSGSEVEELHILLCELARYYRDLEIERISGRPETASRIFTKGA